MDSCSNSNLPRKLALSPITDMSDAELEHAATAPFRWIALSASEHRHNSAGLLLSRTKRTIENPIESIKNVLQIPKDWWATNFTGLYLVPGGRYLVTSCWDCCLAVWDLGYVSDGDMSTDGKPPKMWVTKANYIENFVVHPTPDGLGIRILTHSYKNIYIFEIYPQSQTPNLAKIAELNMAGLGFDFRGEEYGDSLFGNRAVIYTRETKGIVIVWDFIADTVASWSITNPSFFDQIIKVTETAVIILSRSAIPSVWIFQIPLLITKMPLFDIEDLPEIAPVLTITYPDHLPSSWCQKPDAWYHSDLNSLPLYIDISTNCETGDFNRSRLDIANDLSTVFLIPIPTSTIQYPIDVPKNYLKEYRICNGESVNISENWARDAVESYTSSALCGTSSDYHPSQRPALRVNMTRLAVVSRPSTFCPASGRLVYTLSSANNRTPSGGHIVISDFL